MIKLFSYLKSGKIVSAIVGVAAAGAITVTAVAANHPAAVANTDSQTSSIVSSTASSMVSSASSSAPESKGEVKTVDDGVSAIQKATDDGVSRIKSEAGNAVSEIESEANAKKPIVTKSCYQVINPVTLETVYPSNSDYDIICQQLGGDAGTVPMEKSTACAPYYKQKVEKMKQGAIAAYQAAQSHTK